MITRVGAKPIAPSLLRGAYGVLIYRSRIVNQELRTKERAFGYDYTWKRY